MALPPAERRVQRELGTNVERQLQDFQRWLYCSRGAGGRVDFHKRDLLDPLRYSFRPSIILRSEAELLAVSSPRFAIRAYLTKHSFVNARRLKSLKRAIRTSYFAGKLCAQIVRDIGRSSGIADCLLELPDDLRDEGYHVLSVDLAREYGEPDGFSAVPFVKHIRLGGGLCAQAACFMASCLLPETPVFGPAEITAKVSGLDGPADDERFVEIGGMTAQAIRRFFSDKVPGVSASLQYFSAEPAEWQENLSLLTSVFRGYLQSGSPIVYLASASRMYSAAWRPGCLDTNAIIKTRAKGDSPESFVNGDRSNLPLSPDPSSLRKRRVDPSDAHAVLLVGWNPTQPRFLLNDPGSYPFLPASVCQIVDIRQYKCDPVRPAGASLEDRSDGNPAGSDLSEADLGPLMFIPIVEFGVRAFLLDVETASDQTTEPKHSGNERPFAMGLFVRARMAQLDPFSDAPIFFDSPSSPDDSSWWLAETTMTGIRGQFGSSCPFPPDVQSAIEDWGTADWTRQIGPASSSATPEPLWRWHQFVGCPDACGRSTRSIWIWNAQLNGFHIGRVPLSSVLIAVLGEDSNSNWSTIWPAEGHTKGFL